LLFSINAYLPKIMIPREEMYQFVKLTFFASNQYDEVVCKAI